MEIILQGNGTAKPECTCKSYNQTARQTANCTL